MNENVEKFFQLYYSDPALRRRIADAEAVYPGSLEIRDAVASEIILPIAEELGLPFTLMDLKVFETKSKAEMNQDVALTEADLSAPDSDFGFWMVDRGWTYDTAPFSSDEGENR